MREQYLKRGRTIRWEIHGERTWVIRLSEWGIAESDGRTFHARSSGDDGCESSLPDLPNGLIESIRRVRLRGLEIERCTLAIGTASHQIRTGRRQARWEDHSVRLHLAIARRDGSVRAPIDLGAPTEADLGLDEIDEIASVLERVEARRIAEDTNLALAPRVAARLWLELYAAARREDLERGDFVLSQTAHPWNAIDGSGEPVHEMDVLSLERQSIAVGNDLPNVFRPSYRFAPRRLPFNLAARIDRGNEIESRLRALAIAGDLTFHEGRIVVPVVCEEEGRSFAARIEMTCRDWLTKIRSVTGEEGWFPHGAGSVGRWVDVERATLVS